MFGRSQSNNGKDIKIPLTPDHYLGNKSSKSETVLLSRSTTKPSSLSKMLGNSLRGKQTKESNAFRRHLKHLDFNDKENKTTTQNHENNNNKTKQKEIPNETDSNTKTTNINCVTSSPFEHGCLFWEIDWNAIEIELKTKTNGVIRSVPMEVGGHLWFVELYPRIHAANATTFNEETNIKQKTNVNKQSVHNCKFNFFVKSNRTPIHAKFAVYYTKEIKNENVSWKSIYNPNILVFKKNGAGFDKIVNFSDLCTLCVDNKLRLKIEVQVFESVITKIVHQKQSMIQQKLEHKIKNKCIQTRKKEYKELLNGATFADVLLNCNGETMDAHSCILSLYSSKFAELLKEQNKNEDNVYSIDLGSQWSVKVLRGLLMFIYTEQIEDGVDLLEMIRIGDEFGVEMLVLHCLFKLSSDSAALQTNIFDILLWTQKYHHIEEIGDIEINCLKFVTCNLDRIIANKQFQSIGENNPQIFQKVLQFMAINPQ
eukprot:255641_1